MSFKMSGFCATSRTDSNREKRHSINRSCLVIMYKYITNYVFKLFSLGHLIQIESDSFIWILDLG